ncbi:hypothetical protein C8J56DRAFT_796992 [Mycena floridula]|nr:hypothetical protein C8J56DRAFT_796992 [Mycena floridula]
MKVEASVDAGKPCSHCPEAVSAGDALFRCDDCFQMSLVCQSCCIREHSEMPLHIIRRWNGAFFERRSLQELGLRIQMGHGANSACPSRKEKPDKFTVVHTNGIHTVSLDFCQCYQGSTAGLEYQQLLRNEWFPATHLEPQTAATFRVIEQFHLLTLTGKVTPYDFYTSLQRLTDNTGCEKLPDRYRGFLRMAREYRHLIACKRAGRGNDEDRGVSETRPGEIAVQCPACPRPGVNLPNGWENASSDQKFIYTLFIAVDACFRLKRKMVSSDKKDPGLAAGWAYFVEEPPYREFVKTLGDQTEMSSCTGLSAVDHANTRFSRGYAATGVGLALCARHEFIGQNAVGDLQVGEKYGNMTYIVASWFRHICLMLAILVSYDINCQFSKNFSERVKKLPPLVRFAFVSTLFRWVIPKLHILGHKLACQREFNLNYTTGAGRTDGEGVERPWANIGPVSTSTREMGPGHRRDTLDDHWGDWNWRKFIGLGKLLLRRLEDAREELAVQDAALATFTANQAADVPEWKAAVVDWQQGVSRKNPYEGLKSTITIQQVRLALSTEDSLLASAGMPSVHNTSAAEFLMVGLDLEEQQRRLQLDVADLPTTPTPKQAADLLEKRNKLTRQISRFRTIQAVYMPASVQLLINMSNDASRGGIASAVPAEEVVLLFPSSLTEAQRSRGGMMSGLEDMECRLRDAQCQDALVGLRNQLLIKSRLLTYKTVHVRHQGSVTRSRGLVDRNELKVLLYAKRYQAAWLAKLALVGGDVSKVSWRKLNPGDIRCMVDPEPTKRDKQGRGTKRNKPGSDQPVVPQVRRLPSWIWTECDLTDIENGLALRDGLRVEWCKAWARVCRWEEEVQLLEEEMRRVLVTLEWKAWWWEQRISFLKFSDAHSAGCAAYARKQAFLLRRLRSKFADMWSPKAPVLVPREPTGDSAVAVNLMVALADCEGEGDEEEVEENEEAEFLHVEPEDDPIW